MTEIKIIILVSVAFLNLALGLTIILQNKRNIVNRWFFIFSASLAVWSFAMMMYENVAENWQVVYYWSLVLHFAGAGIAHSFLYFTLVYPGETMPIKKILRPVLYLPLVVISYFLFINPQIIVDLEFVGGVRNLIYGNWYPFYFVYFFVFMGIGVLALLVKFLSSTGIQRKRVFLLLFSVIPPLMYSAVINMVFVALGNFRYAWTGPIALFVMVAIIAYSIIKLNFLDVKLVATQIFAVFIILLTFIEIFLSSSAIQIFYRTIIFIITLVFALLLVRSVRREISRREQMERLTSELKKTTEKLVNANKAIQKNNEHLKKLLEMRSEFLDIASHQLKTPVSVILGTSSMFKEGAMDKLPRAKQLHFIDNIFQKAKKLSAIISDILKASEMDTEEFKLVKENIKPAQLEEIIDSVMEDLSPLAKEKKIKLLFKRLAKPLKPVLVDADFLRHAIFNLVDNAIKYTKNGQVIIGLFEDKLGVKLTIADDGIGIPVADQPKMFDKFSRAKNAVNMYADGSGLGLFIVKKIVDAHGGKISFTSQENHGTIFTIFLPTKTKIRTIKTEKDYTKLLRYKINESQS